MVTKIDPVEGSSNIAGIGYDGGTLAVRFHNGKVFHYMDVPADVAAKFSEAESKGRFFATEIRGSFESAKVDEEDGQ